MKSKLRLVTNHEEQMSSKHWTMQIFLRRLGVFILCAGLVAACLIYWSADEASRVTGYSIVDGQAYANTDMASKSDRYEVQRYGGASAVIAMDDLFVDGTARPMVAGIAGCAIVSFMIAWVTLRSAKARALA
jgi:hypothetical protein